MPKPRKLPSDFRTRLRTLEKKKVKMRDGTERGLTQTEMAKLLDVSLNSIWKHSSLSSAEIQARKRKTMSEIMKQFRRSDKDKARLKMTPDVEEEIKRLAGLTLGFDNPFYNRKFTAKEIGAILKRNDQSPSDLSISEYLRKQQLRANGEADRIRNDALKKQITARDYKLAVELLTKHKEMTYPKILQYIREHGDGTINVLDDLQNIKKEFIAKGSLIIGRKRINAFTLDQKIKIIKENKGLILYICKRLDYLRGDVKDKISNVEAYLFEQLDYYDSNKSKLSTFIGEQVKYFVLNQFAKQKREVGGKRTLSLEELSPAQQPTSVSSESDSFIEDLAKLKEKLPRNLTRMEKVYVKRFFELGEQLGRQPTGLEIAKSLNPKNPVSRMAISSLLRSAFAKIRKAKARDNVE